MGEKHRNRTGTFCVEGNRSSLTELLFSWAAVMLLKSRCTISMWHFWESNSTSAALNYLLRSCTLLLVLYELCVATYCTVFMHLAEEIRLISILLNACEEKHMFKTLLTVVRVAAIHQSTTARYRMCRIVNNVWCVSTLAVTSCWQRTHPLPWDRSVTHGHIF